MTYFLYALSGFLLLSDVWNVALQKDLLSDVLRLAVPKDGARRTFGTGVAGDCVSSGCLSPSRKALVVGGHGAAWAMWNLESGKMVLGGQMQKGTVHSLAISPDGKRVATGGDGAELKVWEARSGKVMHDISGHRAHVTQVEYSRNGKYLVTVADDNMLRLWRADNGRPIATYQFIYKRPNIDGVSILGDAPQVKAPLTITFKRPVKRLYHFSISPCSRTVAVTTGEKEVLLLELPTGRVRTTFSTAQKNGAYCVAFSPDGKTLAIGGLEESGSVELWDVVKTRRLATLKRHFNSVDCLAFSPNGRVLVSGGTDGARVWDLTTGKQTLHVDWLRGHGVRFVGFLADGATFVTAGGFRPACFWNATTGWAVSPIRRTRK